MRLQRMRVVVEFGEGCRGARAGTGFGNVTDLVGAVARDGGDDGLGGAFGRVDDRLEGGRVIFGRHLGLV